LKYDFPRDLASLNVKFEEEKPPEGRVQRGLNDFKEFLELAKENLNHVIVIQHLIKTELEDQQP
jgi:hypothetical protein